MRRLIVSDYLVTSIFINHPAEPDYALIQSPGGYIEVAFDSRESQLLWLRDLAKAAARAVRAAEALPANESTKEAPADAHE